MHAFTALLALAAPLAVSAIVTPSEPGPGSVYRAGATCRVTWEGDADSPTTWQNMAIQLMTGSNLAMIHLTTVATDQDGTADGVFTFPCPEVTPNSAIYFYQFTNPNEDIKTWTTRFTIASDDGQSTPPPNPTQPNSDGGIDDIPWGTGALDDPDSAVAPPPFVVTPPGSGTGATGGNTTTTSVPRTTTTPRAGSGTTASPTTLPSLVRTTTPATGLPATTNATTSNNTNTGGAMASVAAMDARVILGLVGVMFSMALW